MPIIVACPTCNGQLRVSDELIGRRVRCPGCNSIFDAAGEAPAPSKPVPAPDRPVETVSVPVWRPPELELPSAPPPVGGPIESPARQNGSIAPKGAVEIDFNGESPPVRPAASSPEPPPTSEERRARLNDKHDDMKPCPECGKLVHRDAIRCTSCGERLTTRRRSRRFRDEDYDEDYDDRPHRGPRRRDWEPHRGGMILTFGIISAATLFVCYLFTPLAFGFGLAAWIMGSSDLRKMRDGTMDPDGEGTTKAGWICGIVGVCLTTLAMLTCGGFFGFTYYMDNQAAKQMKNKQFNVPPPPKQRQQF